MSRKIRQEEQEFGSESFLDVVANVVGILIILVMVVGMRIQKSLAEAVETSVAALDLSGVQTEVRTLETENLRLAAQAADLERAALDRKQQQEQLAMALAAQRHDIEARRQQLDAQSQRELDARRELWSAQSLVEQLQKDLEQTSASKKTVTIQSYPTPLARTVDGKEAHFQLRHGRIAHIPLEELLARLKTDAPSQFWKLKDLPEATATVGPVSGFRLRYTFQRVDVPLEDQIAGKRFVGSYAQLSQWTLIPGDDLLGETLDEALGPASDFRAALAKYRSREVTVTLWTYPDSFNEFRRLKKELYSLGLPTAGRPLPPDAPIGGSPQGSKSAAQ